MAEFLGKNILTPLTLHELWGLAAKAHEALARGAAQADRCARWGGRPSRAHVHRKAVVSRQRWPVDQGARVQHSSQEEAGAPQSYARNLLHCSE